ncbi:glycosyl hydrolase 115 family protein [Coralloluteibacterium stylophorae]|uniref:Glycosyl hydrolase 115 family protein n=1 Tax=Coralloluteibacterium stylophorae TaxID=1776034 RepID=A0A8J7VRL2_9GAMM|nr:glycosyl hydrolase 115 family protein [Coralloluteibacterium stylophorae]MBS7458595.1 glycosyl hydrolase 115 family protein [Coralloluteibacterium stylophorae]
MRFALLLAGLAVFVAPGVAAADCARPAAVCEEAVAGALALIDDGVPLPVLADDGDAPAVLHAAQDLRDDLAAVAGAPAPDRGNGPTAIIAGTLGRSLRIDRIVRERGIDTGGVAGRWEAYLLQVVDDPEPGIDRALVVVGADRRGTVFGLYELSRRIGVSPWTWWADVPPPRRTALHAAPGRFVDAPAVRYRGIFINDEDPALGGWLRETYGGADHRFYERVFELILRHKANYLWPAMWVPRAFYDDDPRNAELADEMGVVIGTTHHEPMMRAHAEWETHGAGPWDYARNGEALRRFWRRGIERMGDREGVVTLGMRGDGDEAMTEGTATALLERIVADQRRIIAGVTGRRPQDTPQVWALYKEVQDYFDAGMRVPDDVTLLFADDNWGNLRRLPEPGAQRPGGYGVYYHFDYVGGPRNYKWINTTQIERTWEQMRLAYAHGVDRLWIVNVGDIKPMELPTSFFLDQAWDPGAMTLERMSAYPAAWAAEQFGPAHADAIGEILTRYTQYNARRKPELLSADTWSLDNFDEADRVLAEWDDLEARTRRLRAALPQARHDAYYQLVEYPVLASANINRLYVAVARNRQYALQGRASANAWADEAERLFARDAELARVYEEDIAGGKWIHMMAQPRIGYTHWQQPPRNVLPALSRVDVPEAAAMGVALEGDPRGWPVVAETAALPPLDPLGAPTRTLTVFNRGARPLRYTATASAPWLRVLPAAGEVDDEQALRVEVDWAAMPPGTDEAHIDLLGSDRTEVHVRVPVSAPASGAGMHGFVESDGHIAIEAPHHARAVATDGLAWQTIPHLGRTLAGVTAWPAVAASRPPGDDGARLEYPVTLREAGEVEVRVVVSPTLDYRNRGGLRFGVSLGETEPQVVALRFDPTPGHPDFQAWQRAVSDGVHVVTSRHRVEAGPQTLTLWHIDPGVVFQRIEIVRGPLRPSYLGPPESVRR